MKKNTLLIVILVVVLLLLVSCVCAGVVVGKPILQRALATATTLAKGTSPAPLPTTKPMPTPAKEPNKEQSGDRPDANDGTGVDIKISYSHPVKDEPFLVDITLINHTEKDLPLCAVILSGDITELLSSKPWISPAGQNVWVEGDNQYLRGENFEPCLTLRGKQSLTITFRMISHIESFKWEGEIGVCGAPIPETNPEQTLARYCAYVPVSFKVP